MKNKFSAARLFLLPIFSLILFTSCANNFEDKLQAPFENSVAALTLVSPVDAEEFTKNEYISRKRESVKYFLGEFKDVPDPEFDQNAPLKIPNQEDVEILFKYLRKHIDSLELEGPDPEILKKNIFMNESG